ncbi:HEAT repeat-containing protein 6 [Exaiptasia diaphana]|nr:HEAT repeat-containing protein 6 [Exaiptasia diaphana]
MAYEEDSVRWQKISSRLVNLRKTDNDEFFTNINVILDELNSLDYSSRIVSENENALQVLTKCCSLIPGNGTNDLLATKLCQLIVNLLSRQKVIVNQTVCDSLLEFLTGSIQCCQKWALINHLQALDAVFFENGAQCIKFADKLLAPSPEGLLTGLINGAGWDIEVRIKAVICVGNICNNPL